MDPMLRPGLCVPGVARMDFAPLYERGIRHYCLDVDNTLALQGAWEPAEGVAEALARGRQAGFVSDTCLVSNLFFGTRRRRRLEHLARRLGVPHVVGASWWSPKPGPAPFLEALARMGAQPGTTVMIGDQLFTDVLGANRIGIFSVLVRPLGADHWSTTLVGRRRRERPLLRELGLWD